MTTQTPSRALIIAAFLALYIIWGSTYLVIKIAIQSLPPFFMGAIRFILAGGMLYAWCRWQGAGKPTREHWKTTLLAGSLMLGLGNGFVIWSSYRIPSGLVAVLVSIAPLWMVVFDAAFGSRAKPSLMTLAGIFFGILGIWTLKGGASLTAGSSGLDTLGFMALMIASMSWAFGSVYIRGKSIPASAGLTSAMQMLGGALFLLVFSLFHGDWDLQLLANSTAISWIAMLYLVIFGSIVGFSAYSFLLHVTSPALVSTYAYVNPVVALFLGWVFMGEQLSMRTAIAAMIILGGVFLIIIEKSQSNPKKKLAPTGAADSA